VKWFERRTNSDASGPSSDEHVNHSGRSVDWLGGPAASVGGPTTSLVGRPPSDKSSGINSLERSLCTLAGSVVPLSGGGGGGLSVSLWPRPDESNSTGLSSRDDWHHHTYSAGEETHLSTATDVERCLVDIIELIE